MSTDPTLSDSILIFMYIVRFTIILFFARVSGTTAGWRTFASRDWGLPPGRACGGDRPACGRVFAGWSRMASLRTDESFVLRLLRVWRCESLFCVCVHEDSCFGRCFFSINCSKSQITSMLANQILLYSTDWVKCKVWRSALT